MVSRRRIVLSAVAVCFAAAAFCGGVSGRTTLTFAYWGSAEERQVVQRMVAAFEAARPEYSVEQLTPADYWDKIIVMISTGADLDVYQNSFENVAQYGWNGLAEDLGPYIRRDRVDLGQYVPALVEALQYKDRQYFLPKDWTVFNIVYNEVLFDQAGVSYPTEGWTRDDFLTMAKKLTHPQENQWGFGGLAGWSTFGWSAYLLSSGGRVFSADGTRCLLDSPAAVNALQWAVDARYQHQVIPPPGAPSSGWSGFEAGKIAMLEAGHWPIPRWSTLSNIRVNATGWFQVGNLPVKASLYSVGYGISPNSTRKEDAWELVKFLTGVEGQRIIAASGVALPSMPSLASLIPSKRVSIAYINEAPRSESILTNVVEYFNAHRIFVEEFGPMTEGKAVPAAAAANACTRVNALLAPYR